MSRDHHGADLIAHLTSRAEEAVQRGHPDLVVRYVLAHGRLFDRLAIEQPPRMSPNACFQNSAAFSRRPGMTYVEGFALVAVPGLFGFHHAWCVDTDCRIQGDLGDARPRVLRRPIRRRTRRPLAQRALSRARTDPNVRGALDLIEPASARTRWVSTSFYGRRRDGTAVFLDVEDPRWLNFSCANARAFLAFLRLDPGPGPDGEATLPEVRRAVIRARATFDRRAPKFTRASSDTQSVGQCRVIVGGIEEAYFERRLGDFERFVDAVVERGATSIYWG
jgi:hypothetical protein